MVSANQNCFVIMFSVQGKPFHNRRSCHPQEWTPCLFASSVSSAHPGLLPQRILRAHSTWRTAPPSICCTAGEHTAPEPPLCATPCTTPGVLGLVPPQLAVHHVFTQGCTAWLPEYIAYTCIQCMCRYVHVREMHTPVYL